MSDIYQDGQYLEMTKSWHVEDSAWKAEQIMKMINRIDLPIESVAEVGCGAGRILEAIAKARKLADAKLYGFDVAPQAIELCKSVENSDIEFRCHDPLDPSDSSKFDLLLAIDVFEHVPDYLGFLDRCQKKAEYKIYHIPLDIHVSAVLRDRLTAARKSVGHLHYFTAKTALATLEDTGHTIIDYEYTCGALDLAKAHPSLRRRIANVPRKLISLFNTPFAAKLLGGFSLLVLAE